MSKRKKLSKKRKHEIEEITKNLTEKQKLFCELYIFDRECFGNASKAYRTAYSLTPAQYKSAEVSAHRLLRNDKLKSYISELLKSQFNDEDVDNELSKIIHQDKDLVSKGMMIKEYNKLKNRITEKTDITSGGEKITGIEYIVPTKST